MEWRALGPIPTRCVPAPPGGVDRPARRGYVAAFVQQAADRQGASWRWTRTGPLQPGYSISTEAATAHRGVERLYRACASFVVRPTSPRHGDATPGYLV